TSAALHRCPTRRSSDLALDTIGYRGEQDGPKDISGYAEIHIEQGRILEREGLQLGVVESSWYTQKLAIEVLGEQSHTGATAMARSAEHTSELQSRFDLV